MIAVTKVIKARCPVNDAFDKNTSELEDTGGFFS